MQTQPQPWGAEGSTGGCDHGLALHEGSQTLTASSQEQTVGGVALKRTKSFQVFNPQRELGFLPATSCCCSYQEDFPSAFSYTKSTKGRKPNVWWFQWIFPPNLCWEKHFRKIKPQQIKVTGELANSNCSVAWIYDFFFLFQLISPSLSGDFTPLVLSKLVSGFLWALAGKSSQSTKKNPKLLDGGTQDFRLTSEPKECLWDTLWWVKTIILMQFIIKYCCVSLFFQNLPLPWSFMGVIYASVMYSECLTSIDGYYTWCFSLCPFGGANVRKGNELSMTLL